MKIWKINFESGYEEICTLIKEDWQKMFKVSGGDVYESWGKMKFKCETEGEQGDFTSYRDKSNMPIINEKVLECLGEFLEGTCQLLDAEYDGKQLKIVNVLNIIDCLDFEESDLDKKPVQKLVFYKDKVEDQHMFIPTNAKGNRMMRLYVSDDFRKKVLDNGLKGIEFELVWDENPEVNEKIDQENNPRFRIADKNEFFKHISETYGEIYKEIPNESKAVTEIDLFITKPNHKNPFYGVFTRGYSFFKTSVPAGMDCGYEEIILNLPEDIENKYSISKNKYNWAIELVRDIGKSTLRRGFWLQEWYVIPNQSQEEQFNSFKATLGMEEFDFNSKLIPYDKTTDYCGVIVVPPFPECKEVAKQDFIEDGEIVKGDWPIYYKTIIPLYREEIHYYYKEGKDALVSKFMDHGIESIYDLRRKSVV